MKPILRTKAFCALLLAALTFTPDLPAIDEAQRHGDVVYLYDSTFGRLHRYDLATRQFLPNIIAAGSDLLVDEDGLYLASGRTIYRYNLDGTGRRTLATVSSDVGQLLSDGNLLIAIRSVSSTGKFTSLNKTTGAILDSEEDVESLHGAAIAPVSNRIYGRNRGLSPADLTYMQYDDAGTFGSNNDSPHHGDYPGADRVWVFPDEKLVVDDSGSLYQGGNQRYSGSFGGAVDDIVFHGVDVPIVLRGTELIAFNNTQVETGRVTLQAPAEAIVLHDGKIFAFRGTGTPEVEIVGTSDLNLAEPGSPKSAVGLPYVPDGALLRNDGSVYLFSRAHSSLFGWSAETRRYVDSLPLSPATNYVAYSPDSDQFYSAHENFEVRRIDPTGLVPVDSAFTAMERRIIGLSTAGDHVMIAAEAQFGRNFNLFSPAGEFVSRTTGYRASEYTWNAATRTMRYITNLSPRDIHQIPVNPDNTFGRRFELPYHGEYRLDNPLRTNPAGSRVLAATGNLFDGTTLQHIGALPSEILDARWLSDEVVVTVREVGGLSQVQRFSGDTLTPGVVAQVTGEPRYLFAVPQGVLLITQIEGAPSFALLDPDTLEPFYITPAKPEMASSLRADGRTDTEVTVAWDDLSDNEDGFRVEYRDADSSGSRWEEAGEASADQTEFTIMGLTPGTNYDFRVIAFNSAQDAAPSEGIAVRTLSHPDAPVGEPYRLAATRVFATTATLEWQDNADNENGFYLYRLESATAPLASGERFELLPDERVFVDTGLTRATTYFYRVEVFNDSGAGEVSAPVSVTTLWLDGSPSRASGFSVLASSTSEVTIGWDDTASNEEGFIILRAPTTSFASPVEVGRVGYNVTQFTDSTVEPDQTYYYRVLAYNSLGQRATTESLLVRTAKLGGEFTGHARLHDGVYYFAFSEGDRIERYDLVTRSWLAPVPLSAEPTALWVDGDGMFVGLGRDIVAVDPSGTETPLVTANADLVEMGAVHDQYLIVNTTQGDLVIVRKSDGVLIDTYRPRSALGGISAAPGGAELFGRTQFVSPSDIWLVRFNADGTVALGTDSPFHGNYPTADRTYAFPDGSRVVDDAGTIYNGADLSHAGALGGGINDMVFAGADVPVALRDGSITAYSNTLQSTGTMTVPGAVLRIGLDSDDVLAFSTDGESEHGIRVDIYPNTDLNLATPGAPKNPVGLAYTPDDVFVDRDGVVYLFSKAHDSLFRWTDGSYLQTIPLGGSPDFVAYSGVTHTAYTAYGDRSIRQIPLGGNQEEVPFVTSPEAPRGLATAGEYVFVCDPSGAWVSHFTYRPNGSLVSQEDWNYYSDEYIWNAAKRRMYFFRDDTSPNDLLWEEIAANGTIGNKQDSPYHGDYPMTHPIRVSDSGNRIVIGSGNIFSGNSLEWRASLPDPIDGAVWLSDTSLVAARTVAGLAQVQKFDGVSFAPGAVRQFQGEVHSLVEVPAGLLLVTMLDDTPRFVILDGDTLEPSYVSPTKPLPPTDLHVEWRTHDSITIGWSDGSDNEDGFRIEFRPEGQGDWLEATDLANTELEYTIPGLTLDQAYEIRVFAFNSEFDSDPAEITARTLRHPDAPIGEPYNLSATRIFANSVTLEWTDNAINENGFYIYRLTSAGQPPENGLRRQVSAGTTRFVDGGLSANRNYYYRVEAFNSISRGDISEPLQVRTLSSNGRPSAASGFEILDVQPRSVTVGWEDNSSNENGFIISRSPTSSFSTRIEVGRVSYNVTSFTDTSAEAGQTYYYRIEAYNGSGTRTTSSEVRADTPRLGGEFAGEAYLFDGIYYFAFNTPDRLERYDVEGRSWLEPIPLSDEPEAVWVDGSGIYVGLGSQLVRVSESGEETHIATVAGDVSQVYGIGDDYIVVSDRSANHYSIRKADSIVVEVYDSFYRLVGMSALPGSYRVFGRTSGISPSDIRVIQYSPEGRASSVGDSPYHGDYPGASRVFAFPDGGRVLDNSGTVYSTSDLTFNASLDDGALLDIDFIGGDVPVVLRDDKLSAYTNTLVTTGAIDLDEEGVRVAVSGDSALVFFPDGNETSGLRVESFLLADLNAAEPGQPKNPLGLAFTPDEMFIDRDGVLNLFSKAHLSLFRWSTVQRRYLDTIPLSGTPSYLDYSAETHRVYTGYANGEIKVLELGDGILAVEQAFARTPANLAGLATAGEFVFAVDPSGAWHTHYTFAPDGRQISAVDWNRRSRQYEWSAANRKMYFFRDGTSPNDIHSEVIGPNGVIGAGGESPYHGTYPMISPIRISPDGSVLVLGSGRRYDGNSLVTTGSFDRRLGDIAWLGGSTLTSEATGTDGETMHVIMWDENYNTVNSIDIDGVQRRLFTLDGDKILAISEIDGVPAMTILDSQFVVEFGSANGIAPEISEQPADRRADWGGAARLEVGTTGTQPITYEWSKDGVPIPDSNSRTLDFDRVTFGDAGEYRVRVINGFGEVRSETVSLIIGRSTQPVFTPGNLLVAGSKVLREFRPDGVLVQSIPIPHPDNERYTTGDITVDRFGRVFVYNDSAIDNSYISVYDPEVGTWDHWLDPDMFLVQISHADISLLGDSLYTNRSRFNILTGERTSFPAPELVYTEISAGLDGRLYAIGIDRSKVFELDPQSGEVLRELTLGGDLRGVTASADGTIYASEWQGNIRRYNANGTWLNSINFAPFHDDIDLSLDGRVATGTMNGEISITDSELASRFDFEIDADMTYVAWIPHFITFDTEPDQTPVVEHEPFSYTINFQHSDPLAALRITGQLPGWMQIEDHGDGTATVSGTPMTDSDSGTNPIVITADDLGGVGRSQRFELEVIAVNDAPVVAPVTNRSAPEDTPELRIDLDAVFSDEEEAELSYALTAPQGDGLLDKVEIQGGDLVVVPAADAFGTMEVRVEGKDSAGLAAQTVFVIEITPVPDRPTAEPIPGAMAAADGSPATYALAPYFADADPGDRMVFSISGNSAPQIFSSIRIDETTGELHVEFAEFVSGPSTVKVTARDQTGLEVESEIVIELPPIDQPEVAVAEEMVLNRQTGLIEHRVVVTNVGARAIGGFGLTITGLPAGAEVYNASATMEDGSWMVQHDAPVDPGASVEVLLEYFSRARGMPPKPEISVEHALPLEVTAAPGGSAFAVDRIVAMRDGSVLVEFPSVPGKCYLVQYSSDNRNWRDCLVRVRAGGTRVQWIDQGSPKTPQHPKDAGGRFYRIIEKDEDEDR